MPVVVQRSVPMVRRHSKLLHFEQVVPQTTKEIIEVVQVTCLYEDQGTGGACSLWEIIEVPDFEPRPHFVTLLTFAFSTSTSNQHNIEHGDEARLESCGGFGPDRQGRKKRRAEAYVRRSLRGS